MEITSLESTNRLLRVIIGLLLRQASEQVPTRREQMAVLIDLGLKPTEVAVILGRDKGHIRKELSLMRKGRKGAKKNARQETEETATNG